MTRKLPFTFEEFKAIYSKVPRLCVDPVIKTKDGILLVLRKEHGYENQWHLPGVTVYYRESLEDAVKRATKEEVGIEVTVEKMLGYMEFFREEKERGFGYTVSIVFLCKPVDSKFKLDDKNKDIKFFKTIPENTIAEQKKFLKPLL